MSEENLNQATEAQDVEQPATQADTANQIQETSEQENPISENADNSGTLLDEQIEQPEQDAQSTSEANADPEDLVPENGEYQIFNENGEEVSAEEAAPFRDAFKEANLTSRQAKVLKAAYDKLSGGMAQQIQNQINTASKAWLGEVKADKELGGNNFTNTVVNVKKAISVYGDDGLTNLLRESRLANNPSIVRFLNNVGKTLSEDRIVVGERSGNVADRVAEAKRLYPHSPELWGGK